MSDFVHEFVECRVCDGLDPDCDNCGGSGGGMQTFEVCETCEAALEWCPCCGAHGCGCEGCGCGGEDR